MEASKSRALDMVEAKKTLFPPSKHHFFLTANTKDYILFVGQGSAFLVTAKDGRIELLKEFSLPAIEPLHFISTGSGDIHILHSKGILRQCLEQLVRGLPFVSIEFTQEVTPLKLVLNPYGTYIVVLSECELLFLQKDKIVKRVKYPADMLMEQLVIDCERRETYEPRLVVPNKSLGFPFVFSGRELAEWSNEEYLFGVTEICRQYYQKDQYIPNASFNLTFSSTHNKIYICLPSDILVLSIKRAGAEGVDYLAYARIKVQMKWLEVPYFVSASNRTGAILMIGKERITQANYANYERSKFAVKQKTKDENMIRHGYTLNSEDSFLFLAYDQTHTKVKVLSQAMVVQ